MRASSMLLTVLASTALLYAVAVDSRAVRQAPVAAFTSARALYLTEAADATARRKRCNVITRLMTEHGLVRC